MIVGARRGEGLSEEVVTASVADSGCRRGVIEGIHRQGQDNHAVAADDSLQGVRVGARRGEGLSEEVVAATVTDFRRDQGGVFGMHRQHDGGDTVATVDRLYSLNVGAGFRDCVAVEE